MSPPRRVLVVEDDPKIAQVLVDYLHSEGLGAEAVHDGRVALTRIEAEVPDCIILDVMLPSLDGVGVCRAVRRFSDVPILMLTARIDEIDRLLGLDSGADDYVCKPFSAREVMARVRSLLRRAEGQVIQHPSPLVVDEEALRISWRGRVLPLTPIEFRLLRLLASRPGRVFSRDQLLDELHADLRDVSDRAIDSHIKNLRRKLEEADPGIDCIASVYGVGYRFELPLS